MIAYESKFEIHSENYLDIKPSPSYPKKKNRFEKKQKAFEKIKES